MKKTILFIVLATLCLKLTANAQDQPTLTALQIGDQVPDITLNNIINYPKKTAKIPDFKGKLLILDFWATNCGSCIRAMPKMDRLAKKFNGKLEIIAVSYEKQHIVTAFLKRNSIGRSMQLPIVTDDIQLKKLFPHRILSHEVWINENGTVVGITEPEYVNEANVQAMLDHQTVDMPVKTDVIAYDYQQPLINSSKTIIYSAIDSYKQGVAPKFGAVTDSLNNRLRFYIINFPILQMYMLALDHLLYFPKTFMQIQIRDTTRLQMPSGIYRNPWKQKNNFCYETVQPSSTSTVRLKEIIRQDLNRFFNMNGRMEKRKVKCLVLQRFNKDTHLLATANSIPLNTLHRKDSIKVLSGGSLSNVIWELNEIPNGMPATDETGIKENVEMHLPIQSFANIPEVNRALYKYGLILKEEMRELEFFVLSDAKASTQSFPN
ncbi:TlpA family protein disulfide reductase [Mucilaginibacter sp.]|jgi:thiol-disulfide isomerase/thioredoxin|uniref:TlpA family protein disulfide reductase n=1 Tax=Mucilaginibacter sp. TaxID=1882438 RepID=UPI00356707FD